jgi:tripartite-type tricarboxylate transporter receptor subunit TctC
VPRNTPAMIIEALNKVFNAAVADTTVKTRLADLGALAMKPNTPAQFAAFIAEDAAKWAKVIKASGIKPE